MEAATAVIVVPSDATSSHPPVGEPVGPDSAKKEDPPGWARLATAREGTGTPTAEEERRRGRRWLGSVVAGLMTVGLITSYGWWTGVAFATTMSVLALAIVRSSAFQRLRVTRDDRILCTRAIESRARLEAKLSNDNRRELARLTAMAEDVEEHGLTSTEGSPTDINGRLNALLLAFIDRAIELQMVTRAFSRTKEDQLEVEGSSPAVARVIQLRPAARDACRDRITSLEIELCQIGQAVRLAHEQTFAVSLRGDEVSEHVDGVVDEASRALEAGREAARVL